MNNYFVGNSTFLFLLNEVLMEPLQKIKTISEVDKKNKDNILIAEDLYFLDKWEKFESFFKVIIIYTDEVKTIYLKKLKELNINYILLEKKEYVNLEENLMHLKYQRLFSSEDKIMVSNIWEELVVNLKDINYFSYDRVGKKSFLVLNNKQFFLRKTLGELEVILPEIFFRVERSYLVNMDQIKVINYREEYIVFNDSETIYLNKNKLKTLSEKLSKKIAVL